MHSTPLVGFPENGARGLDDQTAERLLLMEMLRSKIPEKGSFRESY